MRKAAFGGQRVILESISIHVFFIQHVWYSVQPSDSKTQKHDKVCGGGIEQGPRAGRAERMH